MSAIKERVLKEVSENLSEKLHRKPDDIVETLRRFRKLEEHRLLIWHNGGGGGREICRQRSNLVDIILRRLCEALEKKLETGPSQHTMVAVAFGGYGRRELNPFSDVDIMFIFDAKKLAASQEELIRQATTILWDVGFKVGHSTRSIAQSIKLANQDMVTKTAMLESRYLLGEKKVFHKFKEEFEADCIRGKEAEYAKWRFENQAELRKKYGGSVFMQEPNIKWGCGGMRDYQSLLWLSYFTERLASLTKLVEKKILRDQERIALEKAYDFLLRVRTETHYINGRPADQLTLQLQGKIATGFHYPQKNILARCEAFMRDYYQQTQNIHRITDTAFENLQLKKNSALPNFISFFTGKRARVERFDGFYSKNGLLYPDSSQIFSEDHLRLLKAFQYAQEKRLGISAELRDLIGRRLQYINREFQYSKAAREIFLTILSKKGEVARILRLMHEAGVLSRYIPEFGALDCLVQHEFFHRYSADEHTLVCLEKLDEVFHDSSKRANYRAIFQKLEDPATLYLSLLLHDTGKAANRRNHEEQSAILAQRVARRLQLSRERRKSLILLVDSHILLSVTAQTRNLDDPSTIVQFANIVQTRANLEALMLLTLADGMGTSDQNWSDWKENLVWQLYRESCSYLDSGPEYFEQQKRNRSQVLAEVEKELPADYREEIEVHFELMPERYFSTFSARQIAEHIGHFRQFFQWLIHNQGPALAPFVRWTHRPESGHSEVCICGWDRTGLLTRIAGAFLSAEINILSADAFTRGDNLAIDVFRVCDRNHQPVTEQRSIARVEATLTESLMHESFDFRPLLHKPQFIKRYRLSEEVDMPIRIGIDNDSHPIYTLIDIRTPDRLGLLYDLLRCLNDSGINIEFSRIITERDVAIDTFYVTGKHGEKIADSALVNRLQKQLHDAATGNY